MAYFPDTAAAPTTGRIKWVEHSDGTATTYSYATLNGNLVTTTRTGAGSRSGITVGTQTVATSNLGNFVISQVITDIASNLITEQWTTDLTYNSGFDALGRPIKRIYNANVVDFDITQYACCGLEFSRDRMGATTQYFRDGLKRVYKTESKATPVSPVVTNFTTVSGLTQTRSRSIGGQSLFLGSSNRSLDGLTLTTTDPARKSALAAAALLPMLAVLAAAAVAWYFLQDTALDARVVQIVFVGLAALTVPHMALVERVRFSGWLKGAAR